MGSPLFDEVWQTLIGRRTAEEKAAMASVPGAYGLDTSSHQGAVLWAPVAASGRSWVYVKASQGGNPSYPTTDAQWNGAIAAGLVAGAYHYGDPTLSPQANATAFAQQINRLAAIEGHLPPALDLEIGSGNLSGWVRAFIVTLRQLTGCQKVCVYSDVAFFKASIGESLMDDDTVLWLAETGVQPGRLAYFSPRLAFHQYNQAGQLPGIGGNVDLNVALQPLGQLIVGGDNELTPEQAQQLATVTQQVAILTQQVADMHQQLCGLYTAWAGGKTDANNTPYDMLQLVLRNNVEIVQAGILADEIKQAIAALDDVPANGSPSATDASQVADAVVTALAAKLTGAPSV